MNPDSLLQALVRHRDEIDQLDRQILDLLNRRTRVVEKIADIKETLAMPVYEPRREEDIFRNVVEYNGGPLPTDAMKRIFERILDEMRNLQRQRKSQPPGDRK